MTSYWAELAFLPAGLARRVRLVVDGERFGAVTSGSDPQPGDERLAGVVLPGLANGHSHAFHRALRGRTHAGGGSFWTWRERMYDVARRLDPDTYLTLARAAYAEMALAGYTVVGEFHYLHHGPGGVAYEDRNAMGHALIQAASDAGVRLTLLDTCYLAGGLGPDGHLPLDEVQRRFGDLSVDRWADRVADLRSADRVRIGAALHSVRAVPREGLAALAAVARHGAGSGATHRGMPVHAHVSEQPAENAAALAYYGLTPVQLLAAEGVLGPGFTAVHATHLTSEDVGLLGASGCAVCLCPTTERDLADGIGPARALRRAGALLTVGSDQHAVIDPFEEIRGLEMHERLASLERGCFVPAELLLAGAGSGYRSLGWDSGGALCEGGLADFVAVGLTSPRTAGSQPGQVLLSATSADVTDVVVGGRRVVTDRQHRLGDVGQLLADAIH
ncbi:MAG TPA: formimidoylglutamate deiminase, partial [Candidatus Lustribacter sp.]|nr:formimidoylglutamate deiminase [Candidatus Lustribacter sp.]